MNLQEYKDKHPEKKQRLTNLEKKTKTAEILLKTKDTEGMKLLLKDLEDIINSINLKLLSYEELEFVEREKLLTDKERCMWLSNVFNSQEQIIKNTENYLSKL